MVLGFLRIWSEVCPRPPVHWSAWSNLSVLHIFGKTTFACEWQAIPMRHIKAEVLLQPGRSRPLLHQSDQTPPISCATAAAVRPSLSSRLRTSVPELLSSFFKFNCFIPC